MYIFFYLWQLSVISLSSKAYTFKNKNWFSFIKNKDSKK